MNTTKFIRTAPTPDYEGVFFDGKNAAEVIEFHLSKLKPDTIKLEWDGPYVLALTFNNGFRLVRNRWLLWDASGQVFVHGGVQYVRDHYTEL